VPYGRIRDTEIRAEHLEQERFIDRFLADRVELRRLEHRLAVSTQVEQAIADLAA
jgi:hypothetical protein